MNRWLIVLFLFLALCVSSVQAKTIAEAYQESYQAETVGNWDLAIKALIPLYQTYPEGYTLNYRLAWLFFVKGAFANAEYHLKKTLVIAPASFETKILYSRMLWTQKRWADLEQLTLAMLKTNFYHYQTNLWLMQALSHDGKHDLAKKVGLKTLALYPTDVFFLQQYATALQQLDDLAAANQVFSELLILQPNNAVAKAALLGKTTQSTSQVGE